MLLRIDLEHYLQKAQAPTTQVSRHFYTSFSLAQNGAPYWPTPDVAATARGGSEVAR